MMNKKLIALFVVVTTASMNAFIGDVVQSAGRTVDTTVGGASDIALGTADTVTGGDKGVQERMDERKSRREQRRDEREQRRMERQEARKAKYYRN